MYWEQYVSWYLAPPLDATPEQSRFGMLYSTIVTTGALFSFCVTERVLATFIDTESELSVIKISVEADISLLRVS